MTKEKNKNFNFKNFLTGNNNEFAYNLCLQLTQKPLDNVPLLILAENGLGKTHLLNAIKNEFDTSKSNYKIKLVKTIDLFNDLMKICESQDVNSGKSKFIEEFYAKYSNLDILLLEDIDFLDCKTFATGTILILLKIMQENNKKIVATSSYEFYELMRTDFIDFFKSGIIAEIDSNTKEVSEKFIDKFLSDNSLNVSNKICDYIKILKFASIAELSGFLTTFKAYQDLQQTELTIPVVKQLSKIYLNKNQKPLKTG